MNTVYLVLFTLMSVCLLGVAWWFFRRPASPREVEWKDVQAEAAKGGYRLISTEEMANRYRRDPQSLLLVDTRPEGEYRAGHIRGAVNLSLTPAWWGRWRSRKLLAALLGPDRGRFVVFY
jgi:3-mercaptopyruvate sulfurtransferase SseA